MCEESYASYANITSAELEAGRNARGGFDPEQLAAWGVASPPPEGWASILLRGENAGENHKRLTIYACALGHLLIKPNVGWNKRPLRNGEVARTEHARKTGMVCTTYCKECCKPSDIGSMSELELSELLGSGESNE